MDTITREFYLFGASAGAKRVCDIFESLGVKVIGFIDNNKDKWGKNFEGKIVYSPQVLLNINKNQKIVIASVYYEEIKSQLSEMGIGNEFIIHRDKVIEQQIKCFGKDINLENLELIATKNSRKQHIIVDLSEGLELSGAAKWGLNVANALSETGEDVTIFSIDDEPKNNDNIKENIIEIKLSRNKYREAVEDIVKKLAELLPCTVIVNYIAQVFWAATILKEKFKDSVKIVSVVHSDYSRIYEQQELFDQYIDSYICVSKEIKEKLINKYNIREAKLKYKQSPVLYDWNYTKKYSDLEQPIIIGYAARIEKAQKRSDLLIPLIQKLEESGIVYIMNIAGKGSYYSKLEDFIKEHSLETHVLLHNMVPYDKMNEFWKKNDIFINLSDIEGSAISMLEAMSWGVVPIVTRTSGVEAVIEEEKNGYINELNDVGGIFNNIIKLDKNREKLKLFGDLCRKKISIESSMQDYAKFVKTI